MSKVSVIIPFRNDDELIYKVIDNLNYNQDTSEFEIIVINDGSFHSSGAARNIYFDHYAYPNVHVINYAKSRGVGFAFDRGVEFFNNEIIVLMGSDVFPRQSWLTDVISAVEKYPNTIGCSACVGLSPDDMDMDKPGRNINYGCDLLFTVGIDDLPKNSPIRTKTPNYNSLFEGKWRSTKDSDNPYEIGCVYGAFYFTTKQWYTNIGGWDTEIGEKWIGHKSWGSLEPYISLKNFLYGGKNIIHPHIQTGHVYQRAKRESKFEKGVRSGIHRWWNRLFIAHTMLEESLRDEVINYCKPELNLNLAKRKIKDNWELIREIRLINKANSNSNLIDRTFLDGNKLKIN